MAKTVLGRRRHAIGSGGRCIVKRGVLGLMVAVFVLNLDRDQDRRAWMEVELGRIGLPFERLPGVLGRAVPPDIVPYLAAAMADPNAPLKPGEIGCWASHLTALQKVVERQLPCALILEDDVECGPTLMPALAALDRLPQGWGMVRLAWTSKRHVVPVLDLARGVALVKFSRLPLGAAAYLISHQGAVNVLKSAALGREPIDLAWRSWWSYGLETYGVSPAPIRQNIFDQSSIESLGERGTFVHNRHTPAAFMRNRLNRLHGWAAQMRFLGPMAWTESAVRNLTKTARQ